MKLDFSEIVKSTDAYIRVHKFKCSQRLVAQWSNIFANLRIFSLTLEPVGFYKIRNYFYLARMRLNLNVEVNRKKS